MSRKVVVKQVGDDETRKPTETTPSISAASFRAPAGGVGWSPTDLEGAKDVSNVVLDKSEERHFVYAAAFVCFCCVVTYVVAMFFALAPAVAKVVHTNYLKDTPAFDAELRATKGALTHKNSTELVTHLCFTLSKTGSCVPFPPHSASSESQKLYSMVLSIRDATVVGTSFLGGSLMDKFGRKTMLVGSAAGYTSMAIFFLLAYSMDVYAFFVIAALVLGFMSPILPFALVYVADISAKPGDIMTDGEVVETPRLIINAANALNGQNLGILGGAIVAFVVSTNFPKSVCASSFQAAIAVGVAGTLVCGCVIKESLPPSLRKPLNVLSMLPTNMLYKFECLETSDGRKTGQLGIMWRNRYRVCVQLSQIFYNIGFGAGEAIAFSYCLYRYKLYLDVPTILSSFILWLCILFVAAIIGAFVGCKFVAPKLGQWNAVILFCLFGVIFQCLQGVSSNFTVGCIWNLLIGLLGAAFMPLMLAVYFAEGTALERGELGAMNRSTESLGKLLGKYLCGTVYMPWFMKQGGMLCDMDKRDTDLRCGVGIFGSFMGSAEPMVLVAFAYAISFVFICVARCLKDSK